MSLFIYKIALDQLRGEAVGTVAESPYIQELIEKAIESFDFPESGQGYVKLPAGACEMVLSGVAPVPNPLRPVDFCVRIHRGELQHVLSRSGMIAKRNPDAYLTPDWVAAIVYTAEAFQEDPELTEEEKREFDYEGHSHALITLLSGKGPKAPVSSRRFVRNLAGGNAAYNDMSLEEIKALAKEIVEYERSWVTVG